MNLRNKICLIFRTLCKLCQKKRNRRYLYKYFNKLQTWNILKSMRKIKQKAGKIIISRRIIRNNVCTTFSYRFCCRSRIVEDVDVDDIARTMMPLMHFGAHAIASPLQSYILCLGKENHPDSVTHLHIYGISIFHNGRRRVEGKLFMYSSSVRHAWGLSMSKPREIATLLPRKSIHPDNKHEAKRANWK